MSYFAAIVIPRPAAVTVERALSGVEVGERVGIERPERWHLTLCYYGAVATEHLPVLERALTDVGHECAGFSLAVTGGGTFPRARVVWAGVSGSEAALHALHGLHERVVADTARYGDRSRLAGADDGQRSFLPHVTVARRATGADAAALVATLEQLPAGSPFDVTSVVLFHSHDGRYHHRSEHALDGPRTLVDRPVDDAR